MDARLTFWIDYEAFDGASLQLSVYEVIQCLQYRQKHPTNPKLMTRQKRAEENILFGFSTPRASLHEK